MRFIAHPGPDIRIDAESWNRRGGVRADSSIAAGVAVTVIVVAALVAAFSWVYLDARSRLRGNAPVEVTTGSLTIDTPAVWVVLCPVLFVVFFLLQLVARRGDG